MSLESVNSQISRLMTHDSSWKKIKQILSTALELEGKERDKYVKKACEGDKKLLDEVLSLIAAHEMTGALDQTMDDLRISAIKQAKREQMRGKQIGNFRIVRELGAGGMGSVYLAERIDGEFEHQVALKILHSGVTIDSHIRRFMAERQILASLNHSNIATLFDGGISDDGQPWFAMEYVDGLPIDLYCDKNRLTIKERLELFLDVCDAVQFAHGKLVIHRDLKPSNIIVKDNGKVKLLDFGIAKVLDSKFSDSSQTSITQKGILPLTPTYASPEQVLGESVSVSSDIYQLGVILYELLTGLRPYDLKGCTPGQIERIVCEETPPSPSTALTQFSKAQKSADGTTGQRVDERIKTPGRLAKTFRKELDTIILKAMHKEPDRRYTSTEQLAKDIRLYLDGRPVLAHPDSTKYRAGKFIKRHKVGFASSIFIILLLFGYALTITWHSQQTRAALDVAQAETEKAEQISSFLMGMFEAGDPEESLGDTVTARVLLDRGIDQAEQLENQPDVQAQMFEIIGNAYRNLGEDEQALTLFEQTVEIRETLYDTPNSQLADSHYHLGSALHNLGRYRDAFRHYQKAGKIYQSLPDYQSVEYAKSLHTIASLKQSHQEFTEAKNLHHKAKEMRIDLFGPNHPDVASSHHKMGISYLQEQLPDSAIQNFNRALDIYAANNLRKGAGASAVLLSLGRAFENTENYDAAEKHYLEAYEIRKDIFGPNHDSPATAQKTLGDFYRNRGDLAAAKFHYQTAMGILDKNYTANHPLMRPLNQSLGRLYTAMDEPERAEPFYRDALRLLEAVLSPAHSRVLSAGKELAHCLIDLRNFEEAEQILLENLAHHETLLHDGVEIEDEKTATIQTLTTLYTRWGKTEQSELLKERLSDANQ